MDGAVLGHPSRSCFEGILWVLRVGARGAICPPNIPMVRPAGGDLRLWEEQGVWLRAWQALLARLDERKLLDWEEAFLDATFVMAKKGALPSEKTRRGKGTKCMVVVDGQGIPIGAQLASAQSPSSGLPKHARTGESSALWTRPSA